MRGNMGLPNNLGFLLQVEICCMENVKTSKISSTMQPTFFILSPYVWENNGLLNKNYWDDFDIIDQSHSKGNISQFCLYFGYSWTDFNTVSTTMMASRTARKIVILPDLENIGQSDNLQKLLFLRYYGDRLLSKFYRNYSNFVCNKNVIWADVEHVDQDHHLQKSIYLDFIQPILTKHSQNDAIWAENKSLT